MFDKLQTIETRYDELMSLLSDGAVHSDPNQYRTHSKALSEIQPIVEKFRDYKTVESEITETRELADGSDAELQELAEQELAELETRREDLLSEIQGLMVPKDPNDDKNVVLEIRAGTGGDEAGLFAGDLFRMYSRFAERQHWKVDVLSKNESRVGPIKEGCDEHGQGDSAHQQRGDHRGVRFRDPAGRRWRDVESARVHHVRDRGRDGCDE